MAPDALSSASGGELTGELVSDCGLLDAWKPDVSVLQGRLAQPLVDSFSLSHSGEDQPIRTQADTHSMTSASLPPRESGKPAPQSTDAAEAASREHAESERAPGWWNRATIVPAAELVSAIQSHEMHGSWADEQAELKVPDVEHQMQDRGHVDASFDSPLVESRQGSILLSADAPSGEKEDMHSNYFREDSPKRTPTQPLDVISPQRRLSSGSDDTLAQSLVQTRERTSGAGGRGRRLSAPHLGVLGKSPNVGFLQPSATDSVSSKVKITGNQNAASKAKAKIKFQHTFKSSPMELDDSEASGAQRPEHAGTVTAKAKQPEDYQIDSDDGVGVKRRGVGSGAMSGLRVGKPRAKLGSSSLFGAIDWSQADDPRW